MNRLCPRDRAHGPFSALVGMALGALVPSLLFGAMAVPAAGSAPAAGPPPIADDTAARASSRAPAADEVVVTAEGLAALGADPAAAEDEAIGDAKRNAVEQAVGVFLRSRAIGRDFSLAEEEIRTRSEGFIRHWEVVPNSRRVAAIGGGRVLRLRVRATVALLPVVRRLADLPEVYDDLERPRIRVSVQGDTGDGRAAIALIAALKGQGFEVVSAGPAEVALEGVLQAGTTVRLGDRASPYGIGEIVAAGRASLTIRLVSLVSEETLLTLRSEGVGRSFDGDEAARSDACTAAVQALLSEGERSLAESLLVRWAHERQEGHAVEVGIVGLDSHVRALLRARLQEMRGFQRFLAETVEGARVTIRFVTRLETRAVSRRLATLTLERTRLIVRHDRGPRIACIAQTGRHLTRK